MREQLHFDADHPILANHRINGACMLPGLAYIDILYQIFREQGYDFDALELRELVIFHPLAAREGSGLDIDIDCVEHGAGQWKISVESAGPGGAATCHATAQMHAVDRVSFDASLRGGDLKQSAASRFALDEVYARCSAHGMVHTGFMKASGMAYGTPDGVLVDVSLGRPARATAPQFMFHPVLIDASAVAASMFPAPPEGAEHALFLPLYYQSFRASALLNGRCLARVRQASVVNGRELASATLEFFDEYGQQVAELTKLTSKLVRDAQAPVAAQQGGAAAFAAADGTQAFLRRLIAGRLQRPAGQIDVHAGYYEMGLDSAGMLMVVQDIEAEIGQPVSPILPFEYTTIASLAAYLAETFPGHFVDAAPALPGAAEPPAPQQEAAAGPRATDIAIVGMAGRFPGAASIEQLWDKLRQGVDSVREVPAERWDWRRFQDLRSASGKRISKWGGFIEGADRFDAKFFRITPREAELMDPQERLFLEVCWETIEDAGYTPHNLVAARGRSGRRHVGVFAGVMHKDYTLVGMDALDPAAPLPLSLNTAPIANRVSYVCNFHGPSMAIDTVCSSSLTAVHLALQSILCGESEVALAGGVNLSLHPAKYLSYGIAEFHASDGRCRAFGAGGDGYVSAEGVGAVLLKPLHAALRDGDNVYAVIKGSVINHGGAASGVTVPNPTAQAEMIDACLVKSGVPARTIGYVEAHGTGTSLGDPIELQGLAKAFANTTGERQFCAIGSLKSNIGHAESAAGIAGLIKTALQLAHHTLVPSLHAEVPNPYIDFKQTPFYVQTSTQAWQRTAPEVPRRAGISAFGASGSNAHVILEEVDPAHGGDLPAGPAARTCIVPLSAKNRERLQASARRLLEYLGRQALPEADRSHDPRRQLRLSDLAFTLQLGRVALAERVAFTPGTLAELRDQLAQYLSDPDRVQGPRDPAPGAARLEQLAQHWTEGGEVDWLALHEGQRPRRVSLPTYPFARDRFWFPGPRANISRPQLPEPAVLAGTPGHGLLLSCPGWRQPDEASPAPAPRYAAHWAILCGATAAAAEGLSRHLPQVQCRAIDIDESRLAGAFHAAAAAVFGIVKALLLAQPAGEVLVQVVVPNAGPAQLLAGLAGILRTARLEAPRLIGQLIEVDARAGALAIAGQLGREASYPACQRIRYADGLRSIETWVEMDSAPPARLPWKEGGVYLITGGAGGLGLLFAEEIAARLQQATLVITGRSVPGAATQRRIDGLVRGGLQVEYRQTDITGQAAVRALVEHIGQRYGKLDGIIHSAGVIKDNFIIRKSEAEFASVLAPKVDGLVHLDEATRGQALDFFLIFSSGAGATGNLGQADYASANAFMDAYAAYRNAQMADGRRHGRTLSVNWPLWRDGGMGVDAVTEDLMAEHFGMVPMATELGMQACYRAWALERDQVMVMAGDLDKLRSKLSMVGRAGAAPVPAPPGSGGDARLRQGVLRQLKSMFSAITKLVPDDIGTDQPMDELGLDSVMVTQLNQKLAGVFGTLSKTLFYEQRSVGALADYLIAGYAGACRAWMGAGQAGAPAGPAPAEPPAEVEETGAAGESAGDEGIAIIGMSARFPQADDIDAFWNKLKEGRVPVTEIPAERWDWRAYYDADRASAGTKGKSYGKSGAFLEGFADFDPLFFGIAPREAVGMDPQERLFLQECWRAFEDAGYAPPALEEQARRRVGVFCGITKTGFNLWNSAHSPIVYGTSFSSLVNRVSYCMDLRGPSVSVDTMCSSASVALHQACESLRKGDIDMALSGGVNLYLHPRTYLALAQAQLLSGRPENTVFGLGGDGFIPSEGVGVVVLKRLADARRDQDNILAVIRATAISHAGRTNGYGVPDPARQAEVIQAALESEHIDPRTIAYIESAANGAEMGDAIEMTALQKAFGAVRGAGAAQYRFGSVKACLGHGEAVSGMAQLIKVVLQLRHRTLCPTPMPASPNPAIDFGRLPFALQASLGEWERLYVDGKAVPRRAGINSFGAGGVNAHIVVEEYVAPTPAIPAARRQGPAVFVLSAKTDQALNDYKQRWIAYLQAHPGLDLHALAYSLQTGREPMKRRFACVAGTLDELIVQIGQDAGHAARSGLRGADADPAEIASLIAAGNHHDLAALWQSGASIAWRQLYGTAAPGKLPLLPTYPFAQRRYWIDDDGRAGEAAAAPVQARAAAGPALQGAGRFIDVESLLSSLVAEPAATAAPQAAPQDRASTDGAAVRWSRQEAGALIREVLYRILYLDEQDAFDDDINFGELGLTSVSVVVFTQELNREFGLELPETIVFDHPTIRSLAAHIHSRLRAVQGAELAAG